MHHHEHDQNKHDRHDHSHHHHGNVNKTKLVATIFFNIVITLSEYIGGVISGSLALISDAGHNLSDVLSLMLGYAGERVSERDPSRKYTFGLKRFEVLIALVNALSLLIIGIYIIYEAIGRFQNPQPINMLIMLPVAGIGLLGNLLSIIILMKNRQSNLNMKAAFLHLLYDTISSVAVIIGGIILHFTGLLIIDTIISIGIVVMIFWSSMGIIMESLRIFLQGTPSHIDTDNVYNSLIKMEHVQEIHGLHIWSINSNEIFLSCHICVEGKPDSVNSDEIIKNINRMLEEKYQIKHTTLQVENTMICNVNSGLCCR